MGTWIGNLRGHPGRGRRGVVRVGTTAAGPAAQGDPSAVLGPRPGRHRRRGPRHLRGRARQLALARSSSTATAAPCCPWSTAGGTHAIRSRRRVRWSRPASTASSRSSPRSPAGWPSVDIASCCPLVSAGRLVAHRGRRGRRIGDPARAARPARTPWTSGPCGSTRRSSSTRCAPWPPWRSGSGWRARSTTASPRRSPRWATSSTTWRRTPPATTSAPSCTACAPRSPGS